MKYMGSKARIAKEILPIMLKGRKMDQYWVEPFVGGGNLIDKVDGPRIGSDIHEYLISMLHAASKGWTPPIDISETQYNRIIRNPETYSPELVGYVGFALSYGGKWNGGWCRDSKGTRDYRKEAYNNAIKQFPNLLGAEFKCCDYKNLDIPEKSIVYCDPPYEGTTSYKDNFDHPRFWQ